METKVPHFQRFFQWKRKFFLILAVLMIFSFQNCSTQMGVLFESLNSSDFKIQSTSGNGSGYEGKLTGHFVRTLPQDICQGSILATADIDDSGNRLESVDPLTCQKIVENSVSANRLRWSHFQSDVIAVDDGLFFDPRQQNDRGHIESWCQSADTSNSNIDVLIYREAGVSDIQMKLFINQSSSAATIGSSVKVSGLLPGQRKLQTRQLRYSSSSYDLLIALDRFQSQERGDFQAHLSIQLDGQLEEQALVCRLGQELDGAIWPSQLLEVSGDVLKKWPIENKTKLLLLIKPISGPNQLVVYDLIQHTSRPLILDAPSKGNGVSNFILDASEKKLILVSDFQKEFLKEIFSSDFHSNGSLSLSQFVRLSQARDAADYASMPSGEYGYDVAPDSIAWLEAQTIYFKQGASKTQKITDGDKYLYAAKVDGSLTFPMNPSLPTPDAEIYPLGPIPTSTGYALLVMHGFGFHFDFGIVSSSGVFQDLHLLFSSSEFMSNQSSKLPMGSSLLSYLSKVFPSQTGDKIYFSVFNSTAAQMDVYQGILSTGQVQRLFQGLPLGDASSLKLDTQSNKFAWKDSQKSTAYFFDLSTGKTSFQTVSSSLQFDVDFDFSGQPLAGIFAKVDNRFLYQIQTSGVTAEQYIQLKDVQTGQILEVPQTRMKLTKIYKMEVLPERNAALIFADSNNDGDMELYLMSLQGEGLSQLNDRWKLYGSVQPGSLMILNAGVGPVGVKVLFESFQPGQPKHLFLWDGN